MSQNTKEILDKHERFLVEERGTIDVKVGQSFGHTLDYTYEIFHTEIKLIQFLSLVTHFLLTFSKTLWPIYMNKSEH